MASTRKSATEFLEDAGLLGQFQYAEQTDEALSEVPVTVCGLALGLLALGDVWLSSAHLLLPDSVVFHVIAEIMVVLTAILATALLGLYITKIFMMGPLNFVDLLWTSPNDSSRSAAGTMALMALGATLGNAGLPWLGAILWVVALIAHVGILCVFVPQMVRMGIDDIDDIDASCVLPTVGIAMAAGTGLACGIGIWVTCFFWLALLSSLYFYPLAIYRVYFKDPPQSGLVFSNALLLAVPSLLLIQYLTIGGHIWQFFPFTHILHFWVMCAVVLLCFSVPAMLSVEFNAVATDLTYPVSFAAKATLLFWFGYMSEDRYLSIPFFIPVLLLLLLANGVLIFVAARMAMVCYNWCTEGKLPAYEQGVTARPRQARFPGSTGRSGPVISRSSVNI